MLRLVGHLTDEPDVAAAAEQTGAGHDHRGVGRLRRVERTDEVGVEHLRGPVHLEGPGGAVQALDVAGVGRRQGAQQADPPVDHQGGGGHPGEQGDLGVPLLGVQLGPELQAPVLARHRDLLLGQRQGHPAARGLAGQPQLPHLLEELQRLGGGAVVDGPLHARVVELGGGPDPGPLDVHVGALARGVDLDRPEQRRAHLPRQQRGGALRQRRRVQRDLGVGAVQGHPPLVGLQVDRVAGRHERRDVADRVVDGEPVAVPDQVHRLVEVHGGGRVDGDQRQVRAVQLGQPGTGGRGLGGGHHLGREVGGDLELFLDPGDALAQLVGRDAVVGARDVDDAAGGHVVTLTRPLHRSPAPPSVPLACPGADPAAAERGEDSRSARPAARPRHAVLPGADVRPARGADGPGGAVRRGPGRSRGPPSDCRPGWPTWWPATPGSSGRRPRGPTGCTPACCTTPSRSPTSPPTPAAGPRPASPSSRRCSGWSVRATGSRPTGSPVTPRCPVSDRWRRCGARTWARRSAAPSAAACSSTCAPRRTPRSGGPDQ